jgi:hypothetical protein
MDCRLTALAGNGTESWPIVGMSYFALSQHTTGNCAAATALIDWVFWSQTNDAANRLATRYSALPPCVCVRAIR